MKVEKFGSNSEVVWSNKEGALFPMGIAAYHPMAQPGPQHSECFQKTIDNPCANADCQGMCLLGKDIGGFGVGYRCACPIGQKLIDGRRCVPAIDYLLFSSNKVVRGIYPSIIHKSLAEAVLPVSPVSQRRIGMYFAVECDVHGGSFFYADIMDNTVFRVKPDGEGSAPVLVTHVSNTLLLNYVELYVLCFQNDGLISMSFDWLSKQLYYIDNIRNSLEVVKISEQVSSGLRSPSDTITFSFFHSRDWCILNFSFIVNFSRACGIPFQSWFIHGGDNSSSPKLNDRRKFGVATSTLQIAS